jgi:PIN domain nuclease of toxin-antitoxin system
LGCAEVILLDTHIWIWWVNGNRQLKTWQKRIIRENESRGLGISVISCWETAKLAEIGRLDMACSVEEWMREALAYPGMRLIELTPQIAIESTYFSADGG